MPPTKPHFLKTLFLFISRILLRQHKYSSKIFHRSASTKHHHYSSLDYKTDLSDRTFVFNVEETLFRSSSLFPYFMLVAFEAGSLLRSLLLLVLYPLICLVSQETALKVMVMVCFFGIKKQSFRVGTAVLPKFFLEDVGLESYEMLKRARKMVAVTNLPLVMVESFLRDYLEMEHVVGRELKVFCGYFVGFMEEQQDCHCMYEKIVLGEEKIGIRGFQRSFDYYHQLFSRCKEIYLVGEGDKRKWKPLPRAKYPKKLIFHDGRLALRPTPAAALAMFMWLPLGLLIAVLRIIVSITLPYRISGPMLAFSGMRLTVTQPETEYLPVKNGAGKAKGVLYVCNHRTLLDPMYLCFTFKKNLTAVTYSLSRVSEILSPIRTVRLTRNRDQDGSTMERLLDQGDLVVCPEGTTCREPYLLRFSPLFSEMSENIVPVAMDVEVGMFYGTTAGGFKCLDPVFFLMNPSPSYSVKILDRVSPSSTCRRDGGGDEGSKYDVANRVQRELGEALGFECTTLTRRDKYLILAGNEGIVNGSSSTKSKKIS